MLQKLEGTFLRWQRSESGKLHIQVQTSTIIQSVRINKDLLALLSDLLTPNMSISLQVKVKKRHMVAKFVVLMPHCDLEISQRSLPKAISVKVCTSKHCCKSGSKDICNSLEQLRLDQNIGIRIEKVGCLGNCKQAPVIKIEGSKHGRISPQSATELVKKMWQKLTPKFASKKANSSLSERPKHAQ
jgi:(2Fe-2S) ferredoxin